jgi:hypothetical protein
VCLRRTAPDPTDRSAAHQPAPTRLGKRKRISISWPAQTARYTKSESAATTARAVPGREPLRLGHLLAGIPAPGRRAGGLPARRVRELALYRLLANVRSPRPPEAGLRSPPPLTLAHSVHLRALSPCYSPSEHRLLPAAQRIHRLRDVPFEPTGAPLAAKVHDQPHPPDVNHQHEPRHLAPSRCHAGDLAGPSLTVPQHPQRSRCGGEEPSGRRVRR